MQVWRWFLCSVTAILVPIRCVGSDPRRAIAQAVARGTLDSLSREIATFESENGMTAIHLALHAHHRFLSRGIIRSVEPVLKHLANLGSNVSMGCPIVDAAHFREIASIRTLLALMRPGEIVDCVREEDITGQNILHVAASNKVSGLSRLTLLLRNKQVPSQHRDIAFAGLGIKSIQADETFVRARDVVNALTLEDIEIILRTSKRSFGADRKSWSEWVDRRDKMGFAPLHVACRDGRVDLVKMLVKYGADINRKDVFGRSCADLAHLMRTVMGKRASKLLFAYLRANDAAFFLVDDGDDDDDDGSAVCDDPHEIDGHRDDLTIESLGATTGGWRPPSSASLRWLLDFLSIVPLSRRVRTITAEEYPNASIFVRDFVSLRRPVVVKGIEIGINESPQLARVWSREGMLNILGNERVAASTSPYREDHYGSRSNLETLRTVVETWVGRGDDETLRDSPSSLEEILHASLLEFEAPQYVFDPQFMKTHAETLLNTSIRGFLSGGDVGSSSSSENVSGSLLNFPTRLRQFYVGGEFSGSFFHFHSSPAWNGLVSGLKLWFLFPPCDAIYGTDHPMQWLAKNADALFAEDTGDGAASNRLRSPFVVVQNSGDVVLVPEQWSHAVLNIGESTGIAFEFWPVARAGV